MIWKIDTHIHSEYSADGNMPLSVIIETAKKRGLNAVAVCDHERILKELPEHCGITVIPGAEFSTEYGHLLALFVSDDIPHSDFKTLCKEIHAAGGIAILAHPFEHEKYAASIHETVDCIDGVEVWNSRADRKNKNANKKALEFAKKYNLKFFAGSDAHSKDEIGNAYFTVDGTDDLKQSLLSQPAAVYGKRTPARYAAKSQLVKLKKTKNGNPVKWFLFYVKCLVNDALNKKENGYVTYSENR